MNKQYLPPLIEIIEPDVPPHNIVELARINDALNYPERNYSFFKQGEFLSIVKHSIIKPKDKPSYLSTKQFDAPLEILPWFINKLEFFRKPSTQGGLPPNKIATDKEEVAGEHLVLGRVIDAGNARREGGYDISNLLRKNHHPRLNSAQIVMLSDSFLFEGGLLDLWKDLAEKYKNGTL